MIVAEQKSLEEIRRMVGRYDKLLMVGCGACVTVCFAGGAKEVGILAASLRMAERLAGHGMEITEHTIQRQCEPEFVAELREKIDGHEALLSLGCGVGVQALAEAFPKLRVLPALNTKFMGRVLEPGIWAEACLGCGNCILEQTGGICPVARCSKSLLNGPCGGSHNGLCEVSDDIQCAWQLIYERLAGQELLKLLEVISPPKDWSTGHYGGPRKIVREDLRI